MNCYPSFEMLVGQWREMSYPIVVVVCWSQHDRIMYHLILQTSAILAKRR